MTVSNGQVGTPDVCALGSDLKKDRYWIFHCKSGEWPWRVFWDLYCFFWIFLVSGPIFLGPMLGIFSGPFCSISEVPLLLVFL